MSAQLFKRPTGREHFHRVTVQICTIGQIVHAGKWPLRSRSDKLPGIGFCKPFDQAETETQRRLHRRYVLRNRNRNRLRRFRNFFACIFLYLEIEYGTDE